MEVAGDQSEVVRCGGLRIYPDLFHAEWEGERLQLTAKEFGLLLLFARNPGKLLRRERIAAEVWKRVPRGRTIDVHVARLRRRLPQGCIQTVIPLGYRFKPI
jgi:DNA-binding response OmpR family regulator